MMTEQMQRVSTEDGRDHPCKWFHFQSIRSMTRRQHFNLVCGDDARADLSRWHFLTGDKEMLWNISNGMKLAVGPGDDHQVMHSSHFLLVDGGGHVRGVYTITRTRGSWISW